MTQVDLYFDFISPFAYLAWVRLCRREEAGALSLRPIPIVFGAVLDHWGQKGPAEIPPKRIFTWKTCLRYAAKEKIPLQFPKTHPFNPLIALRVALPEVCGSDQKRVIDALFKACWQDGLDLASRETISQALTAAGLDGADLLRRAATPEVKQRLRAVTDDAVKEGVFGVPTIAVGRELFWGNDQIETVEAYLQHGDSLDPKELAEAVGRPVGKARRAVRKREPDAVTSVAEQVFHAAAFIADLGIKLKGHGEGWCETTLTIAERHGQQDGFVHAGVQATMADHTAGVAAATLMPARHRVLGVEFKINFLRPATGQTLRCHATVLKAGRTLTIAESSVYVQRAEGETLVSKATVTLALVADKD